MRLFISTMVIITIVGGLAFFSMPVLKEAKRSKMIEAEIESLQAEADKINADNNFMREKIEYLKSDHYKESVAKDRLNLRNKGEKVVVVQPNSEKEDDFRKTLGEEVSIEPNYKKWWQIMMGK